MSTNVISGLFLNLDRCKPGELPNIKPAPQINDGGADWLMWQFDDCTVWLRPDQVQELIAKLVVHLPSTPLKHVAQEVLFGGDCPQPSVTDRVLTREEMYEKYPLLPKRTDGEMPLEPIHHDPRRTATEQALYESAVRKLWAGKPLRIEEAAEYNRPAFLYRTDREVPS